VEGAKVRRAGALVGGAALMLLPAGCGTVLEPGGTGAGPQAAGSCVPPALAVEPGTVAPGEDVVVRGEWLRHGCADAVGRGPGGEIVFAETEAPMTDVSLIFEQGDLRQVLATVDADARHRVEVTVTVPPQAVPGAAVITTDEPAVGPAVVEVAD
jgi:hypothetical protein